ncbi:MAG: LacI family transcriptional regulator [Boseongicola sp. SB0664_bin_43]|uniref:LacI family transcriptional regulator n=1 Tax=Boseongicola sp. SB0664_bin_43 TaxID=2604844 RepID=A0A6B0Y1L7_9RHOB|nr:LacI family transcriptional regulator [Boseongicola sp. SB0664_bin_43]MYK31875.1 LacI family transcriptional regulator [Boseongicola sp. SB0670_bin_30]
MYAVQDNSGVFGDLRTAGTGFGRGPGRMGRATISDIAEWAGVSPATVDRALNGRAGVSAPNRHRVMRAARELGYLPLEGMVPLPSRAARLEFLIPHSRNAFMRDVAESIQLCAQTQPLVKSCNMLWLDGIGPDSFVAALDRVALNTEGVGAITTDHPRTRDAIRRLCESGVRVVTLASDVLSTPRSSYVGIDNRIAGRTAGQIVGMLGGRHEGAVAVFCGSRAFHGHQEREAGFVTFMGEHHPGLEILPTIETGEDSAKLRTAPDLLAVHCVGAGRKGIVEALENRQDRPRIVMHDLTKSTRSWLVEDRIDAAICDDAWLGPKSGPVTLRIFKA